MTYKRYYKIVDCGAMPNTVSSGKFYKSVNHGISGMVGVLRHSAIGNNTSTSASCLQIPYVDGTTSDGAKTFAGIYVRNTDIEIKASANWSSFNQVLVYIEYYKAS